MKRLTPEQEHGMRDFQAQCPGILTPADYFLAGIHFAQGAGMCPVDVDALWQVLQALSGPGHHIRELQATVNISALMDKPHPFVTLAENYKAHISAQAPSPTTPV